MARVRGHRRAFSLEAYRPCPGDSRGGGPSAGAAVLGGLGAVVGGVNSAIGMQGAINEL